MVSAGKAAVERTIVYLIAAVYIIQQLTQLDQLTPLLGSLVFIAIVLLVPKLKGMTLWLTLSFMIVGAGLMLLRGAEAQAWFKAAGINVTVVTLFLFAPLFGIPVRLPEYVEALRRFYEANIRSKTGLFVGTQLLTQIIAVFINVGAIPVVYQMIFVKPLPGMSRLLANSLNRGFAGAVFWSPYFAAMAVVTSSLGLAWSSILPYMIGLSILSLLVSWVVDFRELRHAEAERPTQGPVEKLSGAAFPFGLGLYFGVGADRGAPDDDADLYDGGRISAGLVHSQEIDGHIQPWFEQPFYRHVSRPAKGDHSIPGSRILQRFNRSNRIRGFCS
jgi:hypothetical protein